MSDIYNQLKTAIERNNKPDIRQDVAAYFLADYFTLSNKKENQIGGIHYFYSDKKDDFTAYAKNGYYKLSLIHIFPVFVADNALDCVAEGCGVMLENTQYLK